MTPPLPCKCSHPASVHTYGAGRRECKPSCGCGEFRPGARPRAGEDENTAEGAA